MPEYRVIFTQYTEFTVEAEDEDDALRQAEPMFDSEMRCPVARVDYDDYEVEPVEQEE